MCISTTEQNSAGIIEKDVGIFHFEPLPFEVMSRNTFFFNFPFKSTLYLSFKTNYLLILINLYNL